MRYETEIAAFERWCKLKGYSPATITNYLCHLRKFIAALDCDLEDVCKAGFEYYLLSIPGHSTQRQVHGVLGNFFRHIIKRPDVVQYVPYAPKPDTIPDVYAIEEVQAMIGSLSNIKHRLLLLLQYDGGLRVGELVNIQLSHIDRFRSMVKIAQAKGHKDRMVPLSTTTMQLIAEYRQQHKPVFWLFEGQHKEQYSIRSIQQVNKAAKAACGITKRGCTHILRHSFATHLYEAGVGLADVGERLGHTYGSKATKMYLRTANTANRRQITMGDAIQLQQTNSFSKAI